MEQQAGDRLDADGQRQIIVDHLMLKERLLHSVKLFLSPLQRAKSAQSECGVAMVDLNVKASLGGKAEELLI
jgi:hypothetical protein